MALRRLSFVLAAGLLLAACSITASSPPLPDALGRPALDPLVTLSVVACEASKWCIAAGTNPTSSAVGSTSIEISAGGRGRWGQVKTPALNSATLTAASCWSTGCLLGGSDATGSLLAIVNPAKRVASIESTRLPGSGVAALACPAAGRCLALVTTSIATAVYETSTSGSSWQQLSTLPPALSTATAMSCATPHVCVAVGTGPTGAQAARTTDGGRRWSLAARPRGLQIFNAASCGPTWCFATARRHNGTTELLQSRNRGASWAHYATSVARPAAVACTSVGSCIVAGGGAGGAIAMFARPSPEHVLSIQYVPDPVIAIACASPLRCAGITVASTVSFVP